MKTNELFSLNIKVALITGGGSFLGSGQGVGIIRSNYWNHETYIGK